MKQMMILLLSIFLCGFLTLVKGSEMEEKNFSCNLAAFPGKLIPYIVIAYNDFSIKNKFIDNYSISISDDDNVVVVKFSPNFHPDEGMVLGGKTKYGRFIKYTFGKTEVLDFSRSFSR